MHDVSELVFIYFVQVSDFIKIGMSREWKKRVSNMQTLSPFEVKVLHVELNYEPFERALHKRFKKIRHRGEWFQAHPILLEYIAQRAAYPNRSVIDDPGGWTKLTKPAA